MPFPLFAANVIFAPVNETLVVASVAEPQFKKSPFWKVRKPAIETAPAPRNVRDEEFEPSAMPDPTVTALPAVFIVSNVVPEVSLMLASEIAEAKVTLKVPPDGNTAMSDVDVPG